LTRAGSRLTEGQGGPLSNSGRREPFGARPLAKSRVRAARGAARLLAGPVSGAVPHRYIRSLVEQSANPRIASHIEQTTVLAPPHVDHFAFDSALPQCYRRSKAFDQRHMYHLNNVCISPRTGLCWLPGGPLLEESWGGLIGLLGWGRSALEEPLRGRQPAIDGTLIVLPEGVGYFHWLLESLPAALHALAHEPDATLLLPRKAPRYVEEAAEILGLKHIRRSDIPVRAEHLVLAAKDPFSGFVPSEDLEILRATFLPKIAQVHATDERIYVSRRLDSRRPENENEVERVLSRSRIQIVIAQHLTFSEQITLFASTKLVVGPHGAGLANLVWSDASTNLVEIHPPNYFNDCYARLVVARGGAYRPVTSTSSSVLGGQVPLEELRAAIDESGS
jgi:hypothetical protein